MAEAMKRLILIVWITGALMAEAATTFIAMPIPGRTNQWWTNSPPATNIVGWEAWMAQNENWVRAASAFAGIADAHTNSILGSPKRVAYTTNSVTCAYGGPAVTMPWVVTNYAGMTYTTAAGMVTPWLSLDGGVTWRTGLENMITNTVVRVQFRNTEGPSALTAPVDGVVSNVVVYVLERPDLYGRTNGIYGEVLRVGLPEHPDDVANKLYVDSLMRNTPWWSAQTNVQINGYDLNLSGTWRLWTANTTNSDRLVVSQLGEEMFCMAKPPAVNVSGQATIEKSGTNFVLRVATNGLASAPRLQVTHQVSPANWSWMSAVPSVTGTNYAFTFAPPYADQAFFAAVVASSVPGLVSIQDLLALAPRTVTNANSTTWGYGAGVVTVDGSYVYVSVGTNSWKRAALSAW